LADGRELTTIDRNKFKLANLDTLMSSNDKILKTETGIESFLKKVDKQFLDLQNKQYHEWHLKGIEK
jgi:V-type H+-transporting ATPase subunit C